MIENSLTPSAQLRRAKNGISFFKIRLEETLQQVSDDISFLMNKLYYNGQGTVDFRKTATGDRLLFDYHGQVYGADSMCYYNGAFYLSNQEGASVCIRIAPEEIWTLVLLLDTLKQRLYVETEYSLRKWSDLRTWLVETNSLVETVVRFHERYGETFDIDYGKTGRLSQREMAEIALAILTHFRGRFEDALSTVSQILCASERKRKKMLAVMIEKN